MACLRHLSSPWMWLHSIPRISQRSKAACVECRLLHTYVNPHHHRLFPGLGLKRFTSDTQCSVHYEAAGIHHTHQRRMCSSLHIFSSLVDPMNMWGVILSYAGCSKASKPNYCAASSQGRQMVACFCVPALPVVWLIYSSLIFLSPLLPFFVLYFYWKIYMKSTILNHF